MGLVISLILTLSRIVDPTSGLTANTTTSSNAKVIVDPTSGLNATSNTSSIIVDPTSGKTKP